MTVVVDASVAAKWVADEELSDRARAIYLAEECMAPALIMAEVGNAMWKKQRRKIVTARQVQEAMRALPEHLRLADLESLAPRAAAIAGELDHPIYDCFYLALAERENLELVTDDMKLMAVAKKTKVKVRAL